MAKLGPSPTVGRIAGADSIYTYQTGTSTAQSAYYDYDLSVKKSNPVKLDALGRAVCYLNETTAYRFVIKNASGSTLYTIDNINPIVSPSILNSDMDVNSNSIVSSSAGDITFTTSGSRHIVLDGLYWPKADGTAGYVLSTDGSGNLTWIANGSFWLPDTTPQLGGDLDANGFSIKLDSGTGLNDDSDKKQIKFNTSPAAVNYLDVTNSATGNGPTITAAGADDNINLKLKGKGAGKISISGLNYPATDGNTDKLMKTDGSGNLSFGDYTADSANSNEMIAAAGSKNVTPALLDQHPLVPKAVVFYGSGGQYLYGVTSVTYSPIYYSHLRVNFERPMVSANYAVAISHVPIDYFGATIDEYLIVSAQTATYVDLKMRNRTQQQSYRPHVFSVAIYGELA